MNVSLSLGRRRFFYFQITSTVAPSGRFGITIETAQASAIKKRKVKSVIFLRFPKKLIMRVTICNTKSNSGGGGVYGPRLPRVLFSDVTDSLTDSNLLREIQALL